MKNRCGLPIFPAIGKSARVGTPTTVGIRERDMTRQIAYLFGFVGLAWLGTMCWLSGYRSGYDLGNQQAWDQARAALPIFADTPRISLTVPATPSDDAP